MTSFPLTAPSLLNLNQWRWNTIQNSAPQSPWRLQVAGSYRARQQPLEWEWQTPGEEKTGIWGHLGASSPQHRLLGCLGEGGRRLWRSPLSWPQHSACPRRPSPAIVTIAQTLAGALCAPMKLLQTSRGQKFLISISIFEEGLTHSWRRKFLTFFCEQTFGTMGFSLHMSFGGFVCFYLGVLLGLIYFGALVPSFLDSQLTFLDSQSHTCQGRCGPGLLVFWGLKRLCRFTWGAFPRRLSEASCSPLAAGC